MKKILSFKYVYTALLIFWVAMMGQLFFDIFRQNKGVRFKSQFAPTGERFLFQEKKYIVKFGDQVFGVMNSFFSLSEIISFELDIDVNYQYKNERIFHEIYGKINADRLRNIKDFTFISKRKKSDGKDIRLTSLRGELEGNNLHYILAEKENDKNNLSGNLNVKGDYWLINPVYPFGRNLKALKESKKLSAVYNPWNKRFERIEYDLTGKRETVNGRKAVEVKAKAYGVGYSLFLSETGELLKITTPLGFAVEQMPSDTKVELENFLDVENTFNVLVKNMKKEHKKNRKVNLKTPGR